jgi:hypothetical protein
LATIKTMARKFLLKHCPRDTHLIDEIIEESLIDYLPRRPDTNAWLVERLYAIVTVAPLCPRSDLMQLEFAIRMASGFAHYNRRPFEDRWEAEVKRRYYMFSEELATRQMYWRLGLRVSTSLASNLLERGSQSYVIQTVESLNAKILQGLASNRTRDEEERTGTPKRKADQILSGTAAQSSSKRRRRTVSVPGKKQSTSDNDKQAIGLHGNDGDVDIESLLNSVSTTTPSLSSSSTVTSVSIAKMTPGRGNHCPKLLDFWKKNVSYAGRKGLQYGQAQNLKNMLFWCIQPYGSGETSRVLQPLRIPHPISWAMEHAWPGDFLTASLFASMGLKDIMESYITLTAIEPARLERIRKEIQEIQTAKNFKPPKKELGPDEEIPPDNFYVTAEGGQTEVEDPDQVYFNYLKKEGVPLYMKDMLLKLVSTFKPGCTSHRRMCIMAALCLIDAHFDSYDVSRFLETHLIDNPMNIDFLTETGCVVKIGTELGMITYDGRLIRVPDQDPIVFIYLYLQILTSWETNVTIRNAAIEFHKVVM